jgi:hypothetical protein
VQSVPLSIHKIAHAPCCDYLLQEIRKCGFGASSSAGTSDLALVSGTYNKKNNFNPFFGNVAIQNETKRERDTSTTSRYHI